MNAKDVLDLLRMREVHLPYREIGEVLGVTPAAAHKEAGKHLSSDESRFMIVNGQLYTQVEINGDLTWVEVGVP